MSSVPEPGRERAAEEEVNGSAGDVVRHEKQGESSPDEAVTVPAEDGAPAVEEPGAVPGPLDEGEPGTVEPEPGTGPAPAPKELAPVPLAKPVSAPAPVTEPVAAPVTERAPEVTPAPARAPEAVTPIPVTDPGSPGARRERDPDKQPESAPDAPDWSDETDETDETDEPDEVELAPMSVSAQPVDRHSGRRRLKAALWPPRLSRGQLVVAVLLFSLGLGLAIQVRSTNDHHSQLRGARQEDLVRILDELDSRQQRLQQEKAELEQSLAKLENSSNQAKEAQEQTRKKMTELGVLAGTVRATGPGIVLTVDDPQGQVKADMLLDTLQELRAAGAEAIQINDVRVVVNTYFTDASGGGVQIDGKKVSAPYRFTVVGNPQDLTPALNIPGGVVRTLESHQARATISPQQKVLVDALVDPKTPQYAKPAPK